MPVDANHSEIIAGIDPVFRSRFGPTVFSAIFHLVDVND